MTSVDTFCNDLRLYLELVDSPTSSEERTKDVSKEELQSVVDIYKLEISKLGFLLCQDEEPDAESFQKLLQTVQSSTFAICCITANLAHEAGHVLRSSLLTMTKSIIDNTIALAAATVGKTPSSLKSTIPRLAAMCFQSADTAMGMPLDNKTAIGRPLTRILKQIADAVHEMTQESQSFEGAAPPSFGAASRCMEAALMVLKATAKSLMTSDSCLKDEVEAWERVLDRAKAVGNAVDDLGEASYDVCDPEDVDELKAAVYCLLKAINLVEDEIPSTKSELVSKAVLEAKEVMDSVVAEM
jgi:hypothetical protein